MDINSLIMSINTLTVDILLHDDVQVHDFATHAYKEEGGVVEGNSPPTPMHVRG